MKRRILIILLFICLYFIKLDMVYAVGKDVQAIFKQSYNVDLVTKMINNETINLQLDDISLELTSSDDNIKVILIKTSDDANEYAKSFTSDLNNYYLLFYNGEQKIETSKIDIKIKNVNKVLNVYNNDGKLINKSNDTITLIGNDYFINMTDFIDIENSNYIFTDINKIVNDLEDIKIEDNTIVEIYNSKDIKIENTDKIGTNYKIILNNNGIKSVYTVITKGDINGDAKISLNDVTRLYHHYKNIEVMEEVYTFAGNVTSDSLINLNDITKIYHYYKGIISDL